jgi:hypothetical protein
MRGRFYLDENIDVEMRIIAACKDGWKNRTGFKPGLLVQLRTRIRF